jgi:DNA-binding response OmpR family regulator
MASILVLDDEPAVTRLLTLVLRTEGFRVRQASNGKEGLRVLSQENPDLIILDLQMPVMDGRTFYQAARRGGYTGQVIICSANDAEASRRELGADAAIAKPFDPIVLLSIITGLLVIPSGKASVNDRPRAPSQRRSEGRPKASGLSQSRRT